MSHITGGMVSYERTVKTGDYENKKFRVELSFSVEDGEDYTLIFNHAALATVAKVHEMLGIRGAAKVVQAVGVTPQSATEAKELYAEKASQPTVKRAAPPKPPVVAKPTLAVDNTLADVVDDLGLEEVATVAPIITDVELVERVKAHNQKINNAVAIKQVMQTFGIAAPKTLRDIPADKRAEFLAKVEKL